MIKEEKEGGYAGNEKRPLPGGGGGRGVGRYAGIKKQASGRGDTLTKAC